MLGANVTPFRFKAAKFLSNRFSLGLDVNPGFSYNPQSKNTGLNIMLLPSARYYFVSGEGLKEKKLAFFGDVNAGSAFSFAWDGQNSTSGTNTSFQAGVAPGLLYMINKNVSVDAGIRFNYYTQLSNSWSRLGTVTEFGLQVYLPGKKAKETSVK